MAVEAFARVVKDSPSARLTLIGPDKGDGTSQLVRQRIAELGLGASVECVGPVPKDEVPAWLARSDIFLNTTQYESFGVGVLEAAACGLCIVTTDVGELPYLWSHGRDALLVPSGDSEAMAREVLRVMQDPQLAARLSANARSRAEQFDWSVILPKWEQLLDEVAAKNGKMRTASAAAAEAPTPDCRPEAGASQISATKCQAAED
jgi:glycosyltransferase involved in cell wall biosynthesis